MKSPSQGTHHGVMPRSFLQCSIYIAHIASKYSNLFHDYLSCINSSVNSENAASLKKTLCMPLHCVITCLCCTCVLTYKSCTTQKNIKQHSDHDDQTRFKRISQTPMFKGSWCCITPWHCQGKVPRPLQLHKNPFVAKNTHFHLNLLGADISDVGRIGKKIKAIIVPANSFISLPPLLLIVRDSE